MSKTSLADLAGQKTQMASLVNALFVLLTMLFLASLFGNLPAATLGSAVIDAMLGMVTFKPMRRYFRVNRVDWLFHGGDGRHPVHRHHPRDPDRRGAVAAPSCSPGRPRRGFAVWAGNRNSTSGSPRTGTQDSRRSQEWPPYGWQPLFLADANRFRDALNEMISSNREPVRALVVEATAVSQTDTDGADIVIQVIQVAEDLRSRGISLALAHLEPSILDLWTRAGAIDAVRPDHSFGTVRSAVRHSTPLQPRPSRRPLLHDARRPQVSSWIGAPFPVSRGAGR